MNRSPLRLAGAEPTLEQRIGPQREQRFHASAKLERVRQLVTENLYRRVPLGEAANAAGLEQSYFSAYFHRKIGITYLQWVNALRVAQAIKLLSDPDADDLSIREVSAKCGYRDLRTFERNFKNLIGRTPSQHRYQARAERAAQTAAATKTA